MSASAQVLPLTDSSETKVFDSSFTENKLRTEAPPASTTTTAATDSTPTTKKGPEVTKEKDSTPKFKSIFIKHDHFYMAGYGTSTSYSYQYKVTSDPNELTASTFYSL